MNGQNVIELARGETDWSFPFQSVVEATGLYDSSTAGYTFEIEWDGGARNSFTPAVHTYDAAENVHDITVPNNVVCNAPSDFETGKIIITKTGVSVVGFYRIRWSRARFRGNPTTASGTTFVIPDFTLTEGMVVVPMSGDGVNQPPLFVVGNDTVDQNVGALSTTSVVEVYERLAVAAPRIASRLLEMQGAGFDTLTDSLEAIRDRGDAAWTGGSTLTAADIYTYFTSSGREAAFQANVALLATAAQVAALENISAADVAAAVPTTAQISTAVEAALLNEGDGQALIQAIIDRINSDLDITALEEQAIAAAVRANLSVELARIDATISSRSTLTQTDVENAMNSVLSNAGLATQTSINEIRGAGFDTLTDSLQQIRDNIGSGGGGGASAAEIYAYFTDASRADAFKADIATLLTQIFAELIEPGVTFTQAIRAILAVVSGRVTTSAGANDSVDFTFYAPDNATPRLVINVQTDATRSVTTRNL